MEYKKICEFCGEECVVTGNYQKYCEICRKIIRKNKNKQYTKNRGDRKEYWRNRYKKNTERLKEKSRKWSEENYEYSKIYYQKNKKEIIKKCKKYYEDNKEEISNQGKKYYKNNKERIKKYNEEHKKERNEWYVNKRKKDPMYRLNKNISGLMNYSLKKNGSSKGGNSWRKLAGYSTDELKKHLEDKFNENMNWGNYGSYWEIDHIMPRSSFKFFDYNDLEFKKCWSLSNLQPLEKSKNREKSNKLDWENEK